MTFMYYIVVLMGAATLALTLMWIINELDDIQAEKRRSRRYMVKRVRQAVEEASLTDDELYALIVASVKEDIATNRLNTSTSEIVCEKSVSH